MIEDRQSHNNLGGTEKTGKTRDHPPRHIVAARLTERQMQIRRSRMKITRKLHKITELSLYALFATGLIITEYTAFPWSVTRWALNIHIVAAIVLFPLIISVFCLAHRGNLKWSKKGFQRRTGRIIEVGLFIMFLCGVWLLFIGENKTLIGGVAHVMHLVTAIPLVLLILWHSWRLSLMKTVLATLGVLAVASLLVAASLPEVADAAQTNAGLRTKADTLKKNLEVFLDTAATSVDAKAARLAESIEHKTGPLLSASANALPNEMTAQTSGSLQLSNDKKILFSANFEGGSVSKTDRKTGKVLAEQPLGKEIRTVALNADETLLAATDHPGDVVYILDAETLAIKHNVPVAGRPYGTIYDARNNVFWVTAAEAGRLYGISPNGLITQEVDVAPTPRGLALMPDGRLLITHALMGTVSIYDTKTLPPKLVKTIKLKETTDPVETVSQGLPRVLDRIALSPDLKQAWLPHHLWNFDHPFQFQSIVFPVVSVLWLEPGNEHEVVNRRKQLFKQINIVESGNVQRIVSNPFDATFSDDGEKVYVTMAGSEDLVVFDLARAPAIKGDEGPNGSSGANASKIFPLPGQNPRGIQMDGEDIYIQNAMSMDLTAIATGGSGPFAQMSVSNPSFAKLVKNDPLEPKIRRGLRLFDLAKTSAFPKTPMAGDNWMSCSSCHLDGFNYTNGFLFRSTQLDLSKDAVPGHFSLKSFVTGDFVAEYLRMIRQTQGGMGFDTRFPTPETMPEKPSKEAKGMMEDLHHYVTSAGNLPLFSTWLRGDDGKGSVDHKDWVNSAVCGNCHTRIFDEWAGSMHRLNGQSDPYYMVMEDLAAKEVNEEFRIWCMGCHSPEAVLSGARKTAGVSHLLEKDGQSLKNDLEEYLHAVDEGTGCVFCHRVSKVEAVGQSGGANASLNIEVANRPTYLGEQSSFAPLRWIAERAIRAEPDVHAASFSSDILADPEVCSTCHNEFTPGVGGVTTSTYTEWLASSYATAPDPADRRTCFDCHMHADVNKIGTNIPGEVTNGGPVKDNYFSHNFPGGQYFLVGLRDPERRKMSEDLLKRAATIEVTTKAASGGTGHDVVVRVSNVGAGHNLPTGVSDFRQLWLNVVVTDADGNTVMSSGKLDKNGYLDPDAHVFRNNFADGSGHMLGLDFWNYRRMAEDTRIPPKGHRDEVFALPSNAKLPLQVDVKLMFRIFPQDFTDLVRKSYPDLPNVDAVELHRISKKIGAL